MAASFSITTRQGDQGKTRLFSGEEISKASLRTEAYGSLDECVSILGVARSLGQGTAAEAPILQLQRELFVGGAELATTAAGMHRLKERIDEAQVRDMDQRCQDLEARIQMPAGFILPGGNPVAAHLDHARAVIRRCERGAVALQDVGELDNPLLLIWLNRISDYLWLLAREVEGDQVTLK